MKTYQYVEWFDASCNIHSELTTFENIKKLKQQGIIPSHAQVSLSMRKRSFEDAQAEVNAYNKRRAEKLFLKAEEDATTLELSGAPTQ